MNNKYILSKQESMSLAKKSLLASIYYTAKVEGVNVTFQQVKMIFEEIPVNNLDVDDIQKILNLRNAFLYTIHHMEKPFDLEYAKKINEFVAYNESIEWGVLRNGNVGISGVEYRPTIPVESEVITELDKILGIVCVTERALTYMMWAMRKQLFWDGNKRTGIISANKILIEHGKGILIIEEKNLVEFNERLSKFYETNNYNHLIYFLYDNCVFGLDYTK